MSVIAYEEKDFRGRYAFYSPGWYDLDQLGLKNDSISSLKVPVGWKVTLYEHAGFLGDQKQFTSDTSDVGLDFDDIASSLVVEANLVYYTIKARHSNKVLDNGRAQDVYCRLIQYSKHGRENQQFLFFRDDGGFYTVASRIDGNVVDVRGASPLTFAELILYRWNGGDNQKFRLSEVGENYYNIEAKHSGLVLDVKHRSRDNRTPIIQYPWTGNYNQRFLLETVETLPVPANRERVAPNDIGDVDRMTSFNMPPDETLPRLVGEAYLPYYLIKDGQLRNKTKLRQSPYYKLSRYGYWRRGFYYDHDGDTAQEVTKEFEVGLTEGEKTQIETTLGLQAGWKNAGIEIGASFSLKVTTINEIQRSSKETIKITKSFPQGTRMAAAQWFRADQYVLTRLFDGSEVMRWEITDQNTQREDVWTGTTTTSGAMGIRTRILRLH